MTWIALKMLTGDKAKFFGIVLGLTFAALLITQQGSIFCGLMSRTAGQIYDITGADLWVMDPNVRFIDDVKPMIETNLYRVRGVEGVEWAVPLYKGNGRAKVNSVGVDGDEARGHRAGRPARPGRHVAGRRPAAGADPGRPAGRPPPARRGDGRLHPAPQALPRRGLGAEPALPGMKRGPPTPDDRGAVRRAADRLGPGDPAADGRRPTAGRPGPVLPPLHRPRAGDERPPRRDRRRLRGDADVPVERGRLHDLLAGQAVRPPRAEDPLVCPRQDRGRRDRRGGRPAGSPTRPACGPGPARSSSGTRSITT